MKILITGATGFIGKQLIQDLILKGYHDIHILTRDEIKAQKEIDFPVTAHKWTSPMTSLPPQEALKDVEIVFHLAGESVAEGRWSEQKKQKLISSRVDLTKKLLEGLEKFNDKKASFISSSAIGYYGDRQNEILHEESVPGHDFLAKLCLDWEEASTNIAHLKRSCHVRTGIVLGHNGGALSKMLPPFKAGVGGILASGNQWMSWIHIKDLSRIFIFLMENQQAEGAFNAVANEPVTNYVFTKTLGRTLKRPTLFPLPEFMIKIIFGEQSVILTSSQRVEPKNLLQSGFKFHFSKLRDALEDIIKDENVHHINQSQYIDEKKSDVFKFFSDEKNLEKITPPFLQFHVLNKSTPEITENTIINYRLKIRGIPAKWRSLISLWKPEEIFVDEQLKGPYKYWHHTHQFLDYKNGTLIIDHVRYQLPFGVLGKIVNKLFVRSDILKIFQYRKMSTQKSLNT